MRAPGSELRDDLLGRPAMHGQHLDIGQRPAHARHAANWNADSCGWKRDLLGAECAFRIVAPTEYQSGSPVTSTTTRRPACALILSIIASKGDGQAMRSRRDARRESM